MFAQRHTIAIETAADGSATAYSPAGLTGRVEAIVYVKDGTTPFDNGVDFTITVESTGQSLWTDADVNASQTVYPVQPANLGATGAASVLTEVPIVIANDRVKFVIAQGGNAKDGVFHLVLS